MMKTGADTYKIIEEFCCRMTGTLKEWYHNLGPLKQDELHRLVNTAAVLGILHNEFIGDMEIFDRKNRQEFFEMRCCSLKDKDLERHYQRMTQRYYVLNGFNDHTLKNIYISSLPQELQPEIHRMIAAAQKDVKTLSLGQIHQIALEALEKLCRLHQHFSEVMQQKSKFIKACKKPYLEIKCKDKICSCTTRKKHHRQKYTKPSGSFKKKALKFFKKKPFRGKKENQRCFVCGEKGHFSKRCPNKTSKAAKLINSLQPLEGDLESLYSEQSSADEETIFALQNSSSDNSSSDEATFAESEDDGCFPIYSFKEIGSTLPTPPLPCVEIHILASKFSHPKKVIAYMDTGAQITMMNPSILPTEAWVKHAAYFVAADGKTFRTDLMTKEKIGIRFFPECIVWTKVIGSSLPNKDIVVGMDVYSAANRLQILPTGIKFKREFKPYSGILKLYSLSEVIGSSLPNKDIVVGMDVYSAANRLQILPTGIKFKREFKPYSGILKLYSLSEVPAGYEEIKSKLLKLCADSHGQFSHPNPLWTNKDFFVQLPFKLNEDINPTKATHPGMSPSDLALAREECNQLLQQGLIEPTKSEWACQAFYVEKRSEKIRGKKRLVIDYKPLNHFLKDDKFPIPKTSSLNTFLKDAQVYSKFDMKSGFWQLGIDPNDRYKTAFCIPNAQYQWTVLPFGLKVAPSLFQKAMTRIFEPIIDSILIYIDDVLLFSKDEKAHKQLLGQFVQIAQNHGIMLSEKKSQIAQTEIDFLGMHFSQGKYQPQPHIAQELLNFPDENLTVKQIQQFLGIINYIRNFIPKLARYTSPLSQLLKKNPPPWEPKHTEAVKTLKRIAQTPPALKIPGNGKRILQTDASDHYWGAILIEEINGSSVLVE
uniref:Uncharacterized protein LOC101496717 n=1 Tax=Cicer arietinum TaxID=3827 RepID=A0A1S3DZH9_CICAR|nr:uncharacterized protein LOC101496717 [Cicer arietinum]